MFGTVFLDSTPMADVLVTNGIDVVRTNAHGVYELSDRGKFVYLSTPENTICPNWWHPAQEGRIDFTLSSRKQQLPFTFVHLTDTHVSTSEKSRPAAEKDQNVLYEEGGTGDELASLLAGINSLVPEVQEVFITGDLTDNGLGPQFEDLLEAMTASPVPIRFLPGNHDHMAGTSKSVISPNNYLTHTADPTAYEQYLGPRWFSFDIPGLHVVALDWLTHELQLDDKTQEEWLAADLAHLDPEQPWALLFHDQPGQSLLSKVPRQPVATFSGHWHTSRVVSVDGVLHVNTPPTLFGGLDYSPPMLRTVTWNGSDFSLDSTALIDSDWAGQSVQKATIASSAAGSEATVLWRTYLDGAGHRQEIVAYESSLLATYQLEDVPGGGLECIDAVTGRKLWSRETTAAIKTAPAVSGDLTIVHLVTGEVAAFHAENGTPVWAVESPDHLRRFGWGRPVASGNRVVVGDQADLRCLDATTGETVWRRTDIAPHHNLVNHSHPLIVGDRVFIGFHPTPDHPVALALDDGSSLWDQPSDERHRLPEADQKALIMGAASHDEFTDSILFPAFSRIVSVDRASGQINWSRNHRGRFSPASPLPTRKGVITTIAGFGLEMLDPESGELIWAYQVPVNGPFPVLPYSKSPTSVLAPPLLIDDALYLPCLDGKIRVLSLDGDLLSEIDSGVPLAAPLTRAGGMLIGLGMDGGVFSVELKGL